MLCEQTFNVLYLNELKKAEELALMTNCAKKRPNTHSTAQPYLLREEFVTIDPLKSEPLLNHHSKNLALRVSRSNEPGGFQVPLCYTVYKKELLAGARFICMGEPIPSRHVVVLFAHCYLPTYLPTARIRLV